MQFRSNDDGGSLFITGLVKLVHDGMLIGIDCEHGKAHNPLARSGVGPAVPQTGNAERVTAGQLDLPTHGLAGLVAGLIEVVDQHQAVLALPPRGAVTGLFCSGFAADVVGVPTDLVILGPSWNQAKPSQAARDPTGLVALDHDGRGEPRVRLLGIARRQVDAELFLDPLAALGRGEVGTHAEKGN